MNLHADADQTAIFRPFVKRAWQAHRVEDLPRFLERAFWTATSGRPGAVLLDVPMDLFSRPLPDAPFPLPRTATAPALPADAVLVTDVGWNKNGVAQRYPLPAEGKFITPGGASTMGFGPAAALGVQLACPDRVVVALIGDGGMSAQLPAVPMAVERGLPVIFLVMNNRAHGTIADLQAANFGHSYGCEFRDPDGNPYSPDFAALGRACGADGYDITRPEDLVAALRTAVERRRPAVLDVPMVNEPVPTPGHWNIKDIYQGAFAQP